MKECEVSSEVLCRRIRYASVTRDDEFVFSSVRPHRAEHLVHRQGNKLYIWDGGPTLNPTPGAI